MMRLRGLVLLVLLLTAQSVDARVLRVEVEARTPVLEGRTFGPYGAYELVRGHIVFGFDPAHPMNDRIVDLERAPRNDAGLVEARANFVVLQPADPSKARGVALVEVSNRGGKFSPRYFNRAANSTLDPDVPDAWGDALLMRQGLTVIWLGWQWDVPRDGTDRLRLRVPRARHVDGTPIYGRVRSDWVVDETMPVLPLAHRNHVAYPAAAFDHPDNVLTVRDGREAPRRVVPREAWRFARVTDDGRVVPDSTHIYMEGGFEAGKIYELVYRAKDPAVVGLGLAAIRDVISYAKYDEDALFPVDYGIAVGVSQTGRFLRHFLYQGFNTDEARRPAYDGIYAITAGAGRGSFNHRFAQPSRDAHRYSAFFYPTDLFPFTSRTQRDAARERRDGLLAHLHDSTHVPRTFYVNTGYEYWGRAASLIHTTPAGTEDVAPPAHERIYHLAGTQHFPWSFPPDEDMQVGTEPDAYRGNPIDQRANYRALLVRLVEWVADGEAPPASRYPRLDDDTLVPVDAVAFPAIPGVAAPEVIHTAYRADYGPRWRPEGIVDVQPPALGEAFSVRAPQVDALGNETGGVRNVELRVPLATYAPWALRHEAPANRSEIDDFWGTFVPLPTTRVERSDTGDPRPALEVLYDGRADYAAQVRRAADALIDEGFLLPDDRDRVIEHAEAVWDWVHR